MQVLWDIFYTVDDWMLLAYIENTIDVYSQAVLIIYSILKTINMSKVQTITRTDSFQLLHGLPLKI